MKKSHFFLLLMGLNSLIVLSQNLVDSSSWIAGSTSTPAGFGNYGFISGVNTRELGIGPQGQEVVLWTATPTDVNSLDGGFNTNYVSIDHTKTYRVSVWVKKTGTQDGTTYFGLFSKDGSDNHSSLYLNGTLNNNPYFRIGDLPSLDEWYLLVGFIHMSDYNSTVNIGGVYNTNGVKVMDIGNDFKFSTTSVNLSMRAFQGSNNTLTDREYFYDPRIEAIDGTEPSIADLAAGGNSGGTAEANQGWSLIQGNVIYNDTGNVGIGTNSPDEKLHLSFGNLKLQGDSKEYLTIKFDDLDSATLYEMYAEPGTESLNFDINGQNKFLIRTDGNVGIGTTTPTQKLDVAGNAQISGDLFSTGRIAIGTTAEDPGYALTVKGKIHTQEVKVDLKGVIAPDYVFLENYNLKTLQEVRDYIKREGHLPNIPSAKEMEQKGLNLKIMNLKLLEKIEELTLYTLDQEDKIKFLERRLEKIEKSLNNQSEN
ncbi:tail fiber protein [Aquimarina sp. MMG016]|uniref:tail fiber protein n=1 Tax=Aquimarina sp. MMG016 TaxID=2822690 RepID=UPI001B3A6B73|nr:tail fiber protein [Aquimarina sp. MMG016]MBQ4821403.1 hypothetical protein [Aquimarina sp. MMG016]